MRSWKSRRTSKDVTATTPGMSHGELRRQLAKGAAIVVETNRDMYVGRLDLTVSSGHIVDFQWDAIPTDASIPEDPKMKQRVDWIEDPFPYGGNVPVRRHTFMPGGYCTDPNSTPQNPLPGFFFVRCLPDRNPGCARSTGVLPARIIRCRERM
jgi:hypothetical protein